MKKESVKTEKREKSIEKIIKNQIKIRAYLRDGLSVEEIAKKLGISKSSLYAYKSKNIEFAKLFEIDKEINQFSIEESLLKLVHGHKVIIKRPIKVRDVEYDVKTGRKIREVERIEYVDYEEYKAPDPKACIFALTNRRPEAWSEKVAQSVDDELNVKIVVENKKE